MLETCDELTDQGFGLCGRYGVRGIVGINVDLYQVSVNDLAHEAEVLDKDAYRRVLVEKWLIVHPGEDVFSRNGHMFFSEERHGKQSKIHVTVFWQETELMY